ncbi:MAG: hypothetical protein HQL03_07415 [Nitrospirae bacterium]|nr:hypothetical protein [Nitrospirota bacterium]MBF0590726.1 hypothetical protein [Nitrospirota bacterium]
MPIIDCPFTNLAYGQFRPYLAVRIINSHNNLSIPTYGIIDTGADECAIPANYAIGLKHNLQQGQPKQVSTANGKNTAYRHTTIFQILHPLNKNLLYESPPILVDFMPNLPIVLFGVKNFLSNFVLTIDYPRQLFSIRFSQ